MDSHVSIPRLWFGEDKTQVSSGLSGCTSCKMINIWHNCSHGAWAALMRIPKASGCRGGWAITSGVRSWCHAWPWTESNTSRIYHSTHTSFFFLNSGVKMWKYWGKTKNFGHSLRLELELRCNISVLHDIHLHPYIDIILIPLFSWRYRHERPMYPRVTLKYDTRSTEGEPRGFTGSYFPESERIMSLWAQSSVARQRKRVRW